MAISQQLLDEWIAGNRPYVFHGAHSRDGVANDVVAASILQNGIVPDYRPLREPSCPNAPWGSSSWDDGPEDQITDFVMGNYDEWWLHPRPGHAFAVIDPDDAYGKPLFKIDLRKLNPALICPDDDYLRDSDIRFKDFAHRAGDPRFNRVGNLYENSWGVSRDLGPDALTLGQQVQAVGWGEHESETIIGGFEFGVICYQGVFQPEWIERIA